jgi:PIN domain nuclease of toxin-antitoxin system
MKVLIDTQLWLWLMEDSPRVSVEARSIFSDPRNEIVWSAASIWEIAIKSAQKRDDFRADAAEVVEYLRRGPFEECAILVEHTLQVSRLPMLHKDPFDRILIAQAMNENMLFVTAYKALPAYGDFVRHV